jgi:hypothetical protein
VDKPRISQGRGESATPEPGISIKDFNVRYEQDGEVPQYDRGAHAPLSSETSQENGVGEGVYLRVEKDAPRCWNCASYTHSARECPKPRDQEGRRCIYMKLPMHTLLHKWTDWCMNENLLNCGVGYVSLCDTQKWETKRRSTGLFNGLL